MGGKSAPEAPNYAAAAQQTAASNRQATEAQTAANRPNQYTPFGAQTWSSSENFDQAAYDRAMADWQRQGEGLGIKRDRFGRVTQGDLPPEYLSMMPTRNDYYTTQWDQTTTLDPRLQGALDSQLGLQQNRSDLANSLFPRAQNEFGQAMDWSGFTPFSMAPGQSQFDMSTQNMGPADPYVQKAEDAIYGKFSSRMEPQFQQAADQLDTRLRNQGLKPGDQAYDQALKDLRTSQGDAREQAMYQSIIGSGQEGSRMLGMDLATGGFNRENQSMVNALRGQQFNQGMQSAGMNNTVRQQQIAEEMQRRGFSLNEINAIISGQQVGMPSMPGFNAAGNAGGTNYSGAAQNQYQANLDSFNAGQAAWGNLMGGVTGVMGAAMPFGF